MMQTASQSATSGESPRANGHTQLQELFALTDEQILEIDPEPQDVNVSESAAPGHNREAAAPAPETVFQTAGPAHDTLTQGARAQFSVAHEPPSWLAETMNDPQRGAEARALWERAQRAEREAASYREVFAKPEEARTAAERAGVLDDIDRAYFAGDATQRAQLAVRMMHQDPTAFRAMVFEGLRALEEAGNAPRSRSVADALSRSAAAPSANNATRPDTAQENAAQQAQLAAYASFEKAANEDLERSVGSAIERTLEQALPAVGRTDSAALKERMTSAIRQDIEKTLQSDRQLGEQVALILSSKRLDAETRAQVVRLIGERAQQLVPVATRRALSDWTQTTLAAHRNQNARIEAPVPSAKRELAPAAPRQRASQEQIAQRKDPARTSRTDGREPAKSRVNYGKLSDEQILDL